MKKKLPKFLLASHFFLLAQRRFFLKLRFRKKNCQQEPRVANIGTSLSVTESFNLISIEYHKS